MFWAKKNYWRAIICESCFLGAETTRITVIIVER